MDGARGLRMIFSFSLVCGLTSFSHVCNPWALFHSLFWTRGARLAERTSFFFFRDGDLPCESLLLYEGRGKREKGSFEKKIRNEQTNNTHDEDLFSGNALGLFGSKQQ